MTTAAPDGERVFVGVSARGQVWQARAWWDSTARAWRALIWDRAPDWARGTVGIAPTRAGAIEQLEQLLAETDPRRYRWKP